MATNAQTQHVSTFIKGMDTDTSDMVLAADKYRYAENIRIITNQDSNTGEVRLIEGALLLFTIRDILTELSISGNGWKIREATQIRQYGVLIILSDTILNIGSWFVVRYNKDKHSIGINPWGFKKVFGICTESLGDHKLSLVTNYEDDDNIKLYIADGEHKLMSINIADDAVVYNTINDISDETDIEELDPITNISIIDGDLYAGRIMYCYQFYNRTGTQTRVSPLSDPISTNNYTYGNEKWYGVEYGLDSSIGFSLQFDAKLDYDHVKVFRVSFLDPTSQPLCELIIDRAYEYDPGFTISVNDYGLAALQLIDVSEISNSLYYLLIPRIIEAKNNRLFVSNVKYPTSDDFKEWDARSYSAGDKNESNQYVIQNEQVIQDIDFNEDIYNDNLDTHLPYDPAAWAEINGWNGIGLNINWKYFNKQYGDEDVVDLDLNKRYILKPPYNNYVAQKNSFRRDEVYRFGIVLYDNAGFLYPVKWIADIRTPDIKHNAAFIQNGSLVICRHLGIMFLVNNLPTSCVKFEIVRCKLDIKDRATVTLGVISNTIGYADRTNRCPSGILSLQHLVYPWRGVEHGYGGDSPQAEMEYPAIDDINGTRQNLNSSTYFNNGDLRLEILGHSMNDMFQFVSPEITYAKNSVDDVLKSNSSGLLIDIVDGYYPHGAYSRNIMSQETGYGVSDFFHNSNNTYGRLDQIDTNPDNSYTSIGFVLAHVGSSTGMYMLKTSDTNALITKVSYAYDNIHVLDLATSSQVIYLFPSGYSEEILNRANANNDLIYHYETEYYNGHTDGAKRDQSTSSDTYVKLMPYQSESDYGIYDTDGSVYTNDTYFGIKSDFKFVDTVLNSTLLDLQNPASIYSVQYLVNNNQYIPYIIFQLWLRRDTRIADRNGDAAVDYHDETFVQDIVDRKFNFTNGTPIAISGPCMLFAFNSLPNPILKEYNSGAQVGKTFLCNIRQRVIPYGGYSYNSRINSIYYSFGIVQNTNSNTSYNVIFDKGDCFLQCFEYQSAYRISKIPAYWARTFGVTYSIPVETDIDIYNDHGTTLSKYITEESYLGPQSIDYWSFILYSPCVIRNNWYVLDKYQYLYNSAYSASPTVQSFSSVSQEDLDSLDEADCRTFYSELKTQNEVQDSWLKFKAANFLDVDLRYGPITDLKTFKNELIYWQENATGAFSVNEKQILENPNGDSLILGTGDVLQRYDYISTTYGMKLDLMAKVTSDTDLYWWDDNKTELLVYRFSKSLVPTKGVIKLGIEKNLKNYLNKLNKNSDPLLAYDAEKHEIVFTIGDNESLVYSELLDVFTSIYKINPKHKAVFTDCLHLMDSTSVYKWNELEKTDAFGSSGFGYEGTYIDDELQERLLRKPLFPLIQATVNTASTQPKVFDTIEFGGRFYGGGEAMVRKTPVYLQIQKADKELHRDLSGLNNLRFEFSTPTKQKGYINDKNIGKHLTNIEYDFKMSLPRNGEGDVNPIGHNDIALHYGDRFKGKFMNYTLSSVSNDLDFSLLYIITKFRASWN